MHVTLQKCWSTALFVKNYNNQWISLKTLDISYQLHTASHHEPQQLD